MTKDIPIGAKAKCAACGKTVWLKKCATSGYTMPIPNAPIYNWCARKGSKPRPIHCPVSDGYPFRYHRPTGFEVEYFGEPA